ncbi:MAG: flippase-like domain-containing protein [Deltaproteobacteria bacterium]|nr:flippase-like domain-containing protein [Deltaproteobacteria bacterium]
MPPSPALKTTLKWLLSAALGLVFFWLAFRGVDAEKLWAALKRADYTPLVPFFAFGVVIQVIKSVRWAILLRPLGPATAWRIFNVSNTGWMLAGLIPFRMGEFARPYLISERGGISMTAALATVVVERVFDGLAVTAFFFLSTQLVTGVVIPTGVIAFGFVALAIFSGALVAIVGTAIWHDKSIRFWTRALSLISPRLAAKLVGLLENFHAGLRALPRRRDLALFVFYTFAYWIINIASMHILCGAFDISISWEGSMFALAVVCLSIMIPGGPANAGTFEAGVKTALVEVFRTDAAVGAAYAIVLHAATVVVMVAFGVASMFSHHGNLAAAALRRREGPPVA